MSVEMPKAKGSWLFKILILILSIGLVSSILIPKKLKEEERQNTEISHYRMEEIYKAALQYQKYNGTYTDSIKVIFDFIRTNPEYHAYVDSVVIGGLDSIVTRLNEFRLRQQLIMGNIRDANDSLMIDSLATLQNSIKFDSRQLAGYVDYVHEHMRNLPNMPIASLTSAFVIIDSKQFTLNMDIVRNLIVNGRQEEAIKACGDVITVINSVVRQIKHVTELVPNYKDSSLDDLAWCPTTKRPFILSYVDTSVIKYLNIYSPIDEHDIAMVDHSFFKSTIGGLVIKNHGKIENNEKSWEDN